MDPNFFVASRRRKLPGQQLLVNDRFKAQYSNMLCPFLLEGMDVHGCVMSNSIGHVWLWEICLTECKQNQTAHRWNTIMVIKKTLQTGYLNCTSPLLDNIISVRLFHAICLQGWIPSVVYCRFTNFIADWSVWNRPSNQVIHLETGGHVFIHWRLGNPLPLFCLSVYPLQCASVFLNQLVSVCKEVQPLKFSEDRSQVKLVLCWIYTVQKRKRIFSFVLELMFGI